MFLLAVFIVDDIPAAECRDPQTLILHGEIINAPVNVFTLLR